MNKMIFVGASIVFYFFGMEHLNAETDIEKVCNQTGLKVLSLTYRDRKNNFEKIKAIEVGKNNIGKRIGVVYGRVKNESDFYVEKELVDLSIRMNSEVFSSSIAKDFLYFSAEQARLEEENRFLELLRNSLKTYLPGFYQDLKWFETLKTDLILDTKMRVAQGRENDVYGATLKTVPVKDKVRLEIVLSHHSSEPVPYLLTGLVHELRHARSFLERHKLDGKEFVIEQFVDEAVAYDQQLQSYTELISKNPELFCNFVYPTWSYGELLVPLSWTMNSMLIDLKSGEFMDRYAKIGSYKPYEYLVDKNGRLNKKIKKRIEQLNLKYVK